MIIETRTKEITEKVYIALDGKEFSRSNDARYHEWKLAATAVYTVVARGRRESEKIYSSRKLAEEAIKGSEILYSINKVYLNERLWRHYANTTSN